MEDNAANIRTENGLIIERDYIERGGFRINLRRPVEHDHYQTVYAVINRGENGGWYCQHPEAHSPEVSYVIGVVDRHYGNLMQLKLNEERRNQELRDKLNESYAKDWQDIVARYGEGASDA